MVRTGLASLISAPPPQLVGKRLGLVSHSAAVLPDLSGIVDAFLGAGFRLSALFGAEHGFGGAALDGVQVGGEVDPRTGLPVFSLYGPTLEPAQEMLAGLDALLVDFQDVGVRFYTYLSTLYYVLRAAGRAGLPVFVLDRPNPITGSRLAGPTLQPGFESFVGIVPLPLRHGLTFGELALFLNEEHRLRAPLTVLPLRGWERGMWFDQTGLPWVPPSPAMPHLSTAAAYPGLCLLEGTTLSEGRGTALPFEVAGAPWLDGPALADTLNRLGLPGVRFRPFTFQPSASKHAGQLCQGVQLHVLSRETFDPLQAALSLLATAREQNPADFDFLPAPAPGQHPHFDLLAGSDQLRARLEAALPVAGIVADWQADLEDFAKRRKPYLLYS